MIIHATFAHANLTIVLLRVGVEVDVRVLKKSTLELARTAAKKHG